MADDVQRFHVCVRYLVPLVVLMVLLVMLLVVLLVLVLLVLAGLLARFRLAGLLVVDELLAAAGANERRLRGLPGCRL